MPILLQSSEKDVLDLAREITPYVLYKRSPSLFSNLRNFIIDNLGFGDFVFKDQKEIEINRARNIEEMIENLEIISKESLSD